MSDQTRVSQHGGDDDGKGYDIGDGSPNYLVGCEPGGDGNDRGLVLWTSRFLPGRTLVIVVTITYGGTQGFYRYESGDNGDYFEFLIDWTVGSGVVLK